MNDFSSIPSTLIDPDSVFDQNKFIDILKRILHGKTQLELSKQTGLNNATISRMINGNTSGRPYKSTIDKLAKAIDDPELLADLYDAAGYSESKIKRRAQIICDNGISPDASDQLIHEKFFSSLMRGLSLLTDLNGIEWKLKKGTPNSNDYLIKFATPNLDYWYIRYIDRITSDKERAETLTNIYGDFVKQSLNGFIKVSCATPSYEDFDYFTTVCPYRLDAVASIILFDSKLEAFKQETLLDTALPVKENVPIEDFCSHTQPILL